MIIDPYYGLENLPCVNCHNFELCKVNRLACRDYEYFVANGRYREVARKPTAEIYIRIFGKHSRDDHDK